MMVWAFVLLLSFSLEWYGRSICENGMYCVSDDECPIGNQCSKEFLVEKGKYSSRCVPRDDLNESHFCSLSFKSCEKILPCCSGICHRNSFCITELYLHHPFYGSIRNNRCPK
mmetsp:Transcript_19625/g.26907  ORF Transcript_19625/g.26907 Transcript_19625/m.26907 type:complete len:113 (+) Transcript_19625:134-472(+)